MSSETWTIKSEVVRERAIHLIGRAPLRDDKGRLMVVILTREVSDFGRSKKRRFHAYCNLLADYREVPPEAMKRTLKAHLCPLVEIVDAITGEIGHEPKRVRDLSDEEAAELCEKVVKLAGEQWGISLPASEEDWDIVKVGGIESLMERRAIRHDPDA